MSYGQGFVYIWFDVYRKKYYIGSHMGSKDDGYVCSNKRMLCAYKSRPSTFKRRILFEGFIDRLKLLAEEQKWLDMIDVSELNGIKYYNEKKFATGGDIVSCLPESKRKEHRERSIMARRKGYERWYNNLTEKEKSERAKNARACVKNPRGGRMVGADNPMFGQKHSEETKRIIMSSKAKNRKVKPREKQYIITFHDGTQEIHYGQESIRLKYCTLHPIKFRRFIDTDLFITSNRKNAQFNRLLNSKIHSKTGGE